MQRGDPDAVLIYKCREVWPEGCLSHESCTVVACAQSLLHARLASTSLSHLQESLHDHPSSPLVRAAPILFSL